MSVVDVTRDDFWDTVAVGTVLVDVWSEQCAPCKAIGPHLERIGQERDDLTVAKLEAPGARRLLMGLQVRGLPTLLLYRDGEEVARLSDPQLGPDRVRTWLDEHLDGQES